MDNCPICLEKLDKHVIIKTTCNHSFHYECFVNLLINNKNNNDNYKQNCPLCRKEIFINTVFNNSNNCVQCILKKEVKILTKNISDINRLLNSL